MLPAVSVKPNSNLPGTDQLAQLIGGLMTWVLLACVVAVLAGAAAWGFGARFGHYASQQSGRVMVLGGAVGALVAGAAVAVVNFAFHIGGTVS
jgi:CDP-diglyceride synthetase